MGDLWVHAEPARETEETFEQSARGVSQLQWRWRGCMSGRGKPCLLPISDQIWSKEVFLNVLVINFSRHWSSGLLHTLEAVAA